MSRYKPDPTKTTISILKTTRDRLKKYGKFCDDYDIILNRIMDESEAKKKK